MASARFSLVRGLALTAVAAALFVRGTLAFAGAAETYKAKCAMCHGADGKADTPAGKKMGAHDFASPEVQKMTDAELTTVLGKGKDKMPGYEKSLKEDDIKELIVYIRQFAKQK
jgi:mono/diheme cytochrome c family protein